ncbi:hypothetical protein VZT92_023845 [Zoarces viviparus]|uniref:Uncharacterized protein n=1 Tax=Zoarces viviparus TaxID=48416 RepID=A0AAW1E7L4_ZOAVI
MFDPNLFDQKHIQSQSSVALTVFAVGKYLDVYLGNFITSAEKHFMLGLQVTYYVFTDQADKVPIIELGPRRSLKVIQEFKGRFGSEALGDSVALVHAWYYKLPKDKFTYDRNPKSKAYMETGDYYYHAAIFGGLCDNVKDLADYCFLGIMEDKLNNVEALWHDESHLNKYFWLHKPSRLVSPEYCWDPVINEKRDINVTRLIWAPKHYDKLRTR